jgi:hypothetical protein
MSTHTAPPADAFRLPAVLRNLAELALLLERIERRGNAPDPQQYRSLVAFILAELQRHPRDAALDELLACFPATAELYENLRYASAGLCLIPLEQSVESEQQTRTLLQAMAKAGPAPA